MDTHQQSEHLGDAAAPARSPAAGRPVESSTRTQPLGDGDRHRGQSTVEYALLLLGVATLALLVVAWASGTDGIGRLFDAVLDDIVARF